MSFIWLVGAFDRNARPGAPHHGEITPIVCTVIVLNIPKCLFQQNRTCSAWMKSQLRNVHPTNSPLWLLVFKHGAISPSETSVSRLGTNSEHTHGTAAACVMCHVDVCSLGREEKIEPTSERAIGNKPLRFFFSPPLQKTKSFAVIPESSTKAESQLSPIRSPRAVTISLEVLDENCPD